MKKYCIYTFLVVCVMCVLAMMPMKVQAKDIHIVLDPGHGGENSGATNDIHGIQEEDVNLKIGLYLRDALQTYEGVTVSLTREGDQTVSLEQRSLKAQNENADVLISLHNNALGDINDYHSGGTVIAPLGTYHPEVARIGQELGVCIMHELQELGIDGHGIMQRVTQSGEVYPNGEPSDYYGLIRRGILAELPTIIIEHAFLDDESDYNQFLSNDEQLQILAEADARGIARYYQLVSRDTGEAPEPLYNQTTMMITVTSEYAKDNIITSQTFFQREDMEEEKTTEEFMGDASAASTDSSESEQESDSGRISASKQNKVNHSLPATISSRTDLATTEESQVPEKKQTRENETFSLENAHRLLVSGVGLMICGFIAGIALILMIMICRK